MVKNPILAIKEIGDLVIRRNFQELRDYFDKNGQLDDFKLVEFEVTQNQNNLKINHGLSTIPKDVFATRVIAPSAAGLILNHGKFSSEAIDITVTGLSSGETLKARLFVGTFKGTTSQVIIDESAKQGVPH